MAKSQVSFSDSVDKMISNIPKKGMADWHHEQVKFMENQEKENNDDEYSETINMHENEVSEILSSRNEIELSNLSTAQLLGEIKNRRETIKQIGTQTHHIVIGKKLKYMAEEIILKLNNQSIEKEDRCKKISVRDFVEAAIYDYLEKFKKE